MKKYAAQLLFSFHVKTPESTDQEGRYCEIRIVHFMARGDRSAIRKANTLGRKYEYEYRNDKGIPVRFEYLGMMEIKCLENMVEEQEVWYEVFQSNNVSKTVRKMIPQNIEEYELFRETGPDWK